MSSPLGLGFGFGFGTGADVDVDALGLCSDLGLSIASSFEAFIALGLGLRFAALGLSFDASLTFELETGFLGRSPRPFALDLALGFVSVPFVNALW